MTSRGPTSGAIKSTSASSRASKIAFLPFWRPTTKPTSVAAHFPSGRSPSECASTHCCHGNKFKPARSASSVASSPADDTYSGTSLRRGSCAHLKPRSASGNKIVNGRPLNLRRRKLPELTHRLNQNLPALRRGPTATIKSSCHRQCRRRQRRIAKFVRHKSKIVLNRFDNTHSHSPDMRPLWANLKTANLPFYTHPSIVLVRPSAHAFAQFPRINIFIAIKQVVIRDTESIAKLGPVIFPSIRTPAIPSAHSHTSAGTRPTDGRRKLRSNRVSRLHRACIGPSHSPASNGLCAKSNGSSGLIQRPQPGFTQNASPRFTRSASRFRRIRCAQP